MSIQLIQQYNSKVVGQTVITRLWLAKIKAGSIYNTHGHKLRFPPSKKAQFVTECGIDIQTRLCGAQVEEWNYSLGTYSALEWILELYKEKRLKDPTIVEKFNTYRFADYREQMIDPLRRVTTVSLETRKIVRDAVICRLRNEKNAWTL